MPLHRTAALLLTVLLGVACSTAPAAGERADFLRAADETTAKFLESVPGLEAQIADSAGTIVFPGIGEWGGLFGGTRFGRAVFRDSAGEQLGWAALRSSSFGLGGGIRRFQMLLVLRNQDTLESFMEQRLSGDVGTAVVLGDRGLSTAAQFQNGVAVYQSAGEGALVGLRLSLDWLRYESLLTAPANALR